VHQVSGRKSGESLTGNRMKAGRKIGRKPAIAGKASLGNKPKEPTHQGRLFMCCLRACLLLSLLDRSLSSGEACYRNAEWRARNVVDADLVEELD